jgi:hypothetical protein
MLGTGNCYFSGPHNKLLCGNQILEQVTKAVEPLAQPPHGNRYQSIKVEVTTIDMPEKNNNPSTI